MSKLLGRVLALALVSAVAVVPAASADAHGYHTWRPADRSFGATTLQLDPAAASALTSLGVTPSPIAPATAGDSGLRFPIVNSLRSAFRSGVIKHSGGIALTAGSTRVELTDFYINVDAHPDLTALVGGSRVSILDLDFSNASIRIRGGRLVVGPVGGNLTATAAGALNSAFGLAPGTIPAGLKLGDATVSYRLF